MITLLLAACTPSVGDSGESFVDARVELPAADDRYLDLVMPEVEIPPYTEKMSCFTFTVEDELWVDNLLALQGDFGHHLVVLDSTEPLPDQDLFECTEYEFMEGLHAAVLPGTQLDPGYGIRIASGTQFVLQSHYVNTTDTPLLTRDVARLQQVDPEAVEIPVATITTNHANFSLPANQATELSFDCLLEEDVELLLVGGHMHEWGTRFSASLGPDEDHLESLYSVDPWVAEFRDAPPVSLYMSDPLPIAAGSILRTTCAFDNDEDRALDFPEEMCSTFGYIAGTEERVECFL